MTHLSNQNNGWEKKYIYIKYKFRSDLRWITSSCPCFYWVIWSFIRIQNSCGKRNHGDTDFSFKGLQADPSKWKGSVWWQVPKQPWVTASFQEFSDEVWIERGRGSAGDTLFPKSVRSTPQFTDQGTRYKKKGKTRGSACPSSNLLLMPHEYSLRTRFCLSLRVLTHGFLFITDVGRK